MRTLAHDKALHIIAGAGVALMGLSFGHMLSLMPAVFLVVFCLAGAIGRELYNRSQDGIFDWLDVSYTLAGGAVILLTAFVGL